MNAIRYEWILISGLALIAVACSVAALPVVVGADRRECEYREQANSVNKCRVAVVAHPHHQRMFARCDSVPPSSRSAARGLGFAKRHHARTPVAVIANDNARDEQQCVKRIGGLSEIARTASPIKDHPNYIRTCQVYGSAAAVLR